MKKIVIGLIFPFIFPPAQSNVDWSTEVFPILQSASCLGSCHGSGSSGGLTIGTSASTAYNNIVNVASGCNNLDYIEPSDPNTSHLYLKCTTSFSCGGSRMPRNNSSYFSSNSDQLETIRVWIAEGALEQAQATDTTPPSLVNLSISQDTLDVANGPDSVSISIIAQDAGSGLSTGLGELMHSNNTDQSAFTIAFTSGDTLDTVIVEIVMSDTNTLGDWYVSYIQLTDVDGNDTTYTTGDFASAGFDSGFTLINSTPVFIDPELTVHPYQISLYPNYPNPFNPTTKIRFNIPLETFGSNVSRRTSGTSLRVYDITGRLVEVLVYGRLAAGEHEVQWNASQYSGGVYFAELVSGNLRQAQKMILLK